LIKEESESAKDEEEQRLAKEDQQQARYDLTSTRMRRLSYQPPQAPLDRMCKFKTLITFHIRCMPSFYCLWRVRQLERPRALERASCVCSKAFVLPAVLERAL
jgi:hypothetical protein